MRFPAYTVEEDNGGYRVTIRDVRYSRLRSVGFANTIVELDRELRPRR